LLAQPAVAEDLKLSADQLQQVSAALQKQQRDFQETRDLEPALRDKKMRELGQEIGRVVDHILTAEQAKRFQQIALQQQGARAFADPKVLKELNFTPQQMSKLMAIGGEARKHLQEILQGGPGGTTEELREKLVAVDRDARARIMEMLTEEQKSKWRAMVGEPVKGKIRIGGGAGLPLGRP
jgi:hypothetical protein